MGNQPSEDMAGFDDERILSQLIRNDWMDLVIYLTSVQDSD